MKPSTRIKVLNRLSESSTSAANEAVGRACEEAFEALGKGVDYGLLEFSIEVLATIGFRRSKETALAIDNFIRTVELREIIDARESGVLLHALSKYRTPFTLISKAIEVLSRLRYLETSSVVGSLLWASVHPDTSISKDANSALSDLASYNLSVYYGENNSSVGGIGAAPQLSVIAFIEKMNVKELETYFPGVIVLLEGVLSTSMESATWSSASVTMTRAITPADAGVITVRHKSLLLLKKLYDLCATKSQKLAVIGAMNAATRADSVGNNTESFSEMISNNVVVVLDFFAKIVKDENLQVIQKIENNSYWIHFHSTSEEVRLAALRVKSVIDINEEYSIYKTLVGFEGVFGDWLVSKHEEAFILGSQESRVKEARALALRIEHDGFDVWRQRLLTFTDTDSNDLATFPVFYEFLAEVANLYPDFAMRLLVVDSNALSKVLIPILRGIWDSAQRHRLLALIHEWVKRADVGDPSVLYACAKMFLSTKEVDVQLLGQLLDKAIELKDALLVRQVVSVAVSRSETGSIGEELKNLFLKGLNRLTELGDSNWIREIWFRSHTKNMVAGLNPMELSEVLNNLRLLTVIDYQAEDVLAIIAETSPSDVIDLLCSRMYGPKSDVKLHDDVRYEEIPYQFHALQKPLSEDPSLIVQKVFERYLIDPTLFEYKGAKLLQAVFPQFPDSFQNSLLELVRQGGDQKLKFAVRILRAYSGEIFIHPFAKELIKRLPINSELVNDVAISLQSTGVVTGEYGMSDAYEMKRVEVSDWLNDSDERIRSFAKNYISELEVMRDSERARVEEFIALRKFNYGEE